jgi:hypothetical protein
LSIYLGGKQNYSHAKAMMFVESTHLPSVGLVESQKEKIILVMVGYSPSLQIRKHPHRAGSTTSAAPGPQSTRFSLQET